MPTQQANLYCTKEDIEGLLSELGLQARIDDNNSGTTEDIEATRITQARNYSTAIVKSFCLQHYIDSKLADSWLVNNWSTIIAAYWISARRGNPIPESLQKLYDECLKDLENVKSKKMMIPDIGYRNVDWPAWSNVSVDPRYRIKQIRVQRQTSESTPTQYPQTVDIPSENAKEI